MTNQSAYWISLLELSPYGVSRSRQEIWTVGLSVERAGIRIHRLSLRNLGNFPCLSEFILTVPFFINHPRNPRLMVYAQTPLSKPRGRANDALLPESLRGYWRYDISIIIVIVIVIVTITMIMMMMLINTIIIIVIVLYNYVI